ncbi:unnamed protein product [Gongylonema pulchrum]|uniref:Nucleosome assembly protein n=1 Tax=Gongylonema pulchrum TaxID=637853 RepID=A0A3P7QJB1_9BILA|nr:unnamed protein product [Gongylonema pulchrum]
MVPFENFQSYTLVFHFGPNEYFTQTELKKWYELQVHPKPDEIFDYDGPLVINTKGTQIDWKDGKNVTKKVIKKKQRRGTSGASRFVTKVIKVDSFFNFFDPPKVKDKNEINEDDDTADQELLQADFEIGQLFRDQIVPRAVLFYTGESTADNDIFDEYDDMEEYDEDEVFKLHFLL